MNARDTLTAESPEASTAAPQDDTSDLTYIALSKLTVDPDNVRKQGGENIDDLKALIASQGLLQNLIVTPLFARSGKPNGKFGVVAGGRRLRALQALAAEGRLAKDEEILCKIVTRAQALATSTAENSGREPMSTTDTILAFASMAKAGAGVEDLAVAFGMTPLHVRRRLKLANVSPKLLDLLREDAIKLDQIMALALTEDHELQERVWENSCTWNRNPSNLRSMILGEAVDASRDKLAKFVGLDAYTAAGGQVLRDLFADHDSGYIINPELLQQLAQAKLEAEREAIAAEGWQWVIVVPVFDWQAQQAYQTAPTSLREATPEEAQAIEQAESSLDAARAAYDDWEGTERDDDEDHEEDDKRGEALYDTAEQADAYLERLRDSLRCVAEDVKALAGAVVSLDHSGALNITRGLIRKEDVKKATALASSATAKAGGSGSTEAGESGDGPKVSESLCRRLTAHKTKALQLMLAQNTRIALAALAHTMLNKLDIISRQWGGALDIEAKGHDSELTKNADDLEASPAWQAVADLVAACKAELPSRREAVLPWLLEQDADKLTGIVALCVALSTNATKSGPKATEADALAEAMALDMADYWTPTAGSFLNFVPKAQLIDAVTEAAGADAALPMGKMKKAEAVALAQDKLAGTRWVPSVLRRPQS